MSTSLLGSLSRLETRFVDVTSDAFKPPSHQGEGVVENFPLPPHDQQNPSNLNYVLCGQFNEKIKSEKTVWKTFNVDILKKKYLHAMQLKLTEYVRITISFFKS